MWWMAPIIVAGVAKLAYDAVHKARKTREPEQRSQSKSILESNLARLGEQLHGERGKRKIAIFGQPGAGKSSLLKKMTDGGASPPPVIGIHTDATDWSRSPDCDLLSFYDDCIFADVPGYDTNAHPTEVFIHHFPWRKFDAYIFVIKGKLHHADELIFTHIASSKRAICITKSFCDGQDKIERMKIKRDLISRLHIPKGTPFIFFDNKSGEGVSTIYRNIQKI